MVGWRVDGADAGADADADALSLSRVVLLLRARPFFPGALGVAAPANQRPRFRQHQLFPNMQPPWAVFHPLVSSLPLGHTNSRCPCQWYTASLGVHAKPVPVIHSALHRSIPPTTGLTMAGHESLQRAVACLTCGSRCYLTFDPRHAYTGALS
jgi:hypothetical protein